MDTDEERAVELTRPSVGWVSQLASEPVAAIRDVVAELGEDEAEALAYHWPSWRRSSQIDPPGNWRYLLALSGRGWGKTRWGSEWVREKSNSGLFQHVNIIGSTADDARDVMVEGESGILAVCPRDERPEYLPSKRRLDWPNGCRTLIFTADTPERLRGKQHQVLWADELAAWRNPGEAWTQAKLGLRLPPDPRALITTTPKPLAVLRRLIRDPKTAVVGGTTYENRENLAPEFYDDIIREYEGTAFGRQELGGQLLEQAEGALWRRLWIDRSRVTRTPETLLRIALGIDPSGGATECGLVVAALGEDDQKYVLHDATEKLSPAKWGAKAWRTALAFDVDVVAAEKNFGGDMVGATLQATALDVEFKGVGLPPFKLVTASRRKAVRAEPWAAQAEQGRSHHVGELDELEDELCTWSPTATPRMRSPNRLDAMVWALEAATGKRAVYW